MQKVKAHALRKYEEAKLVEELTGHRVSLLFGTAFHWLESDFWSNLSNFRYLETEETC